MNKKKTFYEKIKCGVRKWMSAKVIPLIVLNGLRIFFYRLCGYRIGKDVFIGMRCYLDDVAPSMFTVEDHVVISYGCYFACHGERQPHAPILIKEGAYLGMRSNVISGKKGVVIGKNALVGACALVMNDVPDGTTVVGVPAKVVKEKAEQ